jgi:hypothetical protein
MTIGLASLLVVGNVGTASAGNASNVVAVEVCDINLNLSVTWTFTNNTNGTATIATAIVNNSLLTSGSINSVNVNMGPSFIVPSLGQASGQTFTSSNPPTAGTLSIVVSFTDAQNTPLQVSTSIVLTPCVAPTPTTAGATTTTTSAATTTTATGVAAAAGQLPHVGQNNSSLPWIALGLVGSGLALVSVRRRPRRV